MKGTLTFAAMAPAPCSHRQSGGNQHRQRQGITCGRKKLQLRRKAQVGERKRSEQRENPPVRRAIEHDRRERRRQKVKVPQGAIRLLHVQKRDKRRNGRQREPLELAVAPAGSRRESGCTTRRTQ